MQIQIKIYSLEPIGANQEVEFVVVDGNPYSWLLNPDLKSLQQPWANHQMRMNSDHDSDSDSDQCNQLVKYWQVGCWPAKEIMCISS